MLMVAIINLIISYAKKATIFGQGQRLVFSKKWENLDWFIMKTIKFNITNEENDNES